MAPFCAGENVAEVITSSFRHKKVEQLPEKGWSPSLSLKPTLFFHFLQHRDKNLLTGLPISLSCSNPSLRIFNHVSLLLKGQVKTYIFQNVLHFYLAFINAGRALPSGLFYSRAPPTLRPLLLSGPTHTEAPPIIRPHSPSSPSHFGILPLRGVPTLFLYGSEPRQ